jgi:phosphate transport system protein
MHRDTHLELLDRLTGLLAVESRTVVTAVRHASSALLNADADEAAAAQRARQEVGDRYRDIEDLLPVLLARQQPLASDLRLVLAAVHMNIDMDRMAALTNHITTIGLSRHPEPVVPAVAIPTVAAMASTATALAEKSALVLATRNPTDAMQLDLDDDETDALQQQLFGLLTEDWPHGTRCAVDLAMLARFYERFADHAVGVAQQVVYLVTGKPYSIRP